MPKSASDLPSMARAVNDPRWLNGHTPVLSATDFTCTVCAAAQGEQCVIRGGRTKGSTHVNRQDRANRTFNFFNANRCLCTDCWVTYEDWRRASVASWKIEEFTAPFAPPAKARQMLIELIETLLALGPIDWGNQPTHSVDRLESWRICTRVNGELIYDPEQVL